MLQTKGRGAGVPDDLAQVVMRALSKDPAARQQNLAAFLDSLAEAAGNAGLLRDARALLIGTIWGEELASPGSYLGELLGSSSLPSSPSPLAATQPVSVRRDPEDEALLSSAPQPFGTTSHELETVSRPKRRTVGWLWASLGLLALVFGGVVAGNWWWRRPPAAVADEQKAQPIEAAPVAVPDDAAIADVGTDAVLGEAPPPEEPLVEEVEVEEAPPAEPEPESGKAKPEKKRKKAAKKTAPAPKPAPVRVSESAPEPVPEPDDGIDWTVPDFPEQPSPPTGTPEAPARNPVVIDEPPEQ
jgi:hypothetical protein